MYVVGFDVLSRVFVEVDDSELESKVGENIDEILEIAEEKYPDCEVFPVDHIATDIRIGLYNGTSIWEVTRNDYMSRKR